MIRKIASLVAALALGAVASAQSISLQLEGNLFKVVGWPAPATPPVGGWVSVFAVYVGGADVPPVLGAYEVEAGTLTFRTRYPLAPGARYRAVFRQAGHAPIEQTFDGPARRTIPSARVERVYPTVDVLPSNQLRLYIYFSTPMSRGEAARRVHILDAGGQELRNVFLPGEELWDPNVQRLTMTFDPGRIKRGLTSNEKMGPPIVEGQRYTLVVDREWPDAGGVPMLEGYRKTFRGGPAVRNPPDPHTWRLVPPRSGSTTPLVVVFDRPMNYPLLQRMLRVAGPHGPTDGTIEVERNESEWRFTPQAPWQSGDYRLVVDTTLEDLAGNRIGQPFDIDVFDKVTEHITTTTIDLPFAVK